MSQEIVNSVIIPFHNEELLITDLMKKVVKVMDSLGDPYEILAVNDGSTDTTKEKLYSLAAQYSTIKPILFTQRSGQTHALAEGFKKAKGSVVITLDGDLQNDPDDIPRLLTRLKNSGADVVCGWRKDRLDPNTTKLISLLGNFFQKILFSLPIHDISCTLRVYRSAVTKRLHLGKEGLHRFLPAIIHKAGFIVEEEVVTHHERKLGYSKYSATKIPRTIRLSLEILFGFHKI